MRPMIESSASRLNGSSKRAALMATRAHSGCITAAPPGGVHVVDVGVAAPLPGRSGTASPIVVEGIGLGGRRLPIEPEPLPGLEDAARQRGGVVTARAAVLDEDDDDDLRIGHGRVHREPGVVLLQPVGDLGRGADPRLGRFGGARLAGDDDELVLGGLAGAVGVVDDGEQAVLDEGVLVGGHRDTALVDRQELLLLLP